MRQEGNDPLILDAGDLFFTTPDLHDSNRVSEKYRASVILMGYEQIGCDAINVGQYEFGGGEQFLLETASTTQIPFISANLINTQTNQLLFNPYIIIEREGLKIGVIGLTNLLPKTIKNIVLTMVLLVTSMNVMATEETAVDLERDLGYFYGYSFGNMLKDGKSTDVDIDRLMQGLKDSLADNPPALSNEQRDAVYNEIQQRQARTQAEQERVHAGQEAATQESTAANLKTGEAFLAENADRTEVRLTASGMQYEVIEDRAGPPHSLTVQWLSTIKAHL